MILADVADFYSEGGGGIKTYIRAKIRAAALATRFLAWAPTRWCVVVDCSIALLVRTCWIGPPVSWWCWWWVVRLYI